MSVDQAANNSEFQFQIAPTQSVYTGGVNQQSILKAIETGAASGSYTIEQEDFDPLNPLSQGVIFKVSGYDLVTVKNGINNALSQLAGQVMVNDVGIPATVPSVTDSIKQTLNNINPIPKIGDMLQSFLDSIKSFLLPIGIVLLLIILAAIFFQGKLARA